MYYTIRLKVETAAARIAGFWERVKFNATTTALSGVRRWVKGREVESTRRLHRAIIARNEALCEVLEDRMDAMQARIDWLDTEADVSESILFSLPPTKAING
jgi:hypothetical protein